MSASVSRRADTNISVHPQNRQMAQHDRFVMTMQFVDLSTTFMAAGDVNRAPHSDDNITFSIYFNALDLGVGDI